jgi:hypothetical protein
MHTQNTSWLQDTANYDLSSVKLMTVNESFSCVTEIWGEAMKTDPSPLTWQFLKGKSVLVLN